MNVKMCKLADLGTLRNGMNYDKTSATKGCKIIGVADFGNRVFPQYESLQEISSEIVSDVDLLKDGDIVFVRSNGNKNLVGRSMFIKNIDMPVCYSGFCISLRPNKKRILPEYLFYVLRSPFCRKQYSYSQQTNITNLSQSVLGEVNVPVPSFEEQEQIARLFYNLDCKIEINTKTCSELEAMAKTLYDYWFVQFDFPDENGRPYRTSGGEMVWNDQLKCEIPKGWRAGKLSGIANITMGQSPDGESYNETGEGMIFYQGRTDFGMRFPTPRMYTTEPTRFAKKGDILLSVRAPVGDLNFAMEDCCIGRGLAALNSKLGSQMHLFYTLVGFQQIFGVMDGNGTTFGSITKDTLFDMGVVIPDAAILKRFEKQVCSIEKKIETCETENRELTKLRDWLLPMLMNGQATVGNTAEKSNTVQFPEAVHVRQAARNFEGKASQDDTQALLREFYRRR